MPRKAKRNDRDALRIFVIRAQMNWEPENIICNSKFYFFKYLNLKFNRACCSIN